MWILIFLFTVGLAIVYLVHRISKAGSRKPTQDIQQIEKCVSSEDIQYRVSSEIQLIVDAVESNKQNIKQALKDSDRRVCAEWLDSYQRIVEISNNLNRNLEYHAKKNLEYKKFQYYTSLHFRSMIAADITYREYDKIKKSYEQIKKNKSNIKLPKEKINSVISTLKGLKDLFYQRVHELNHQTEELREKNWQRMWQKRKRLARCTSKKSCT